MDLSNLEKLQAAVEWLLRQQFFSLAVEQLRRELNGSQEAFRMDDISHEFFPEGEDMTGVSFHTCGAAEPEDYEIELRYEE